MSHEALLKDLALLDEEEGQQLEEESSQASHPFEGDFNMQLGMGMSPVHVSDSGMKMKQQQGRAAPKARSRARKTKKVKSVVFAQESSTKEQPSGILSDLALLEEEEKEQQLEDKTAKAKRKSTAKTSAKRASRAESTKKVQISPQEFMDDEETTAAPLSARQLEIEDKRKARREASLKSASLRPSVTTEQPTSSSSTTTTPVNTEIDTNILYRDSPVGQALRNTLKTLVAKGLIDSNDPTKKDWDKKIFSLFDTAIVSQMKQVTRIKTRQLMEENTNITKFYSRDRKYRLHKEKDDVEEGNEDAKEEEEDDDDDDDDMVTSKVVLKRYNNKPMLVQGELQSYNNLRKFWRVDLENVTLNTGDKVLDRGNVRVLIKAPDERKTKKAGNLNSKRKKAKETKKDEKESKKKKTRSKY